LYKTYFATNFIKDIYKFYNLLKNNNPRRNYLLIKILKKNNKKKFFFTNFFNKFTKKNSSNIKNFNVRVELSII